MTDEALVLQAYAQRLAKFIAPRVAANLPPKLTNRIAPRYLSVELKICFCGKIAVWPMVISGWHQERPSKTTGVRGPRP